MIKPMSDVDIAALSSDLESDRVERKESFRGKAPDTVREAVCAFANDLAGHGRPGVVIIGLSDDATAVTEFEVTDELLRQLADIKTDGNVVPPPSLLVEKRRRHRDRPFDVQPVREARLDALNRLRFEEEYLPAVVAPDVLAANGRTYEQKLAATKMVMDEDAPTPTVLGLLVIGRAPAEWLPCAYAQFLRIDGNDLASPVMDEESIHGTVADQIRRLEEKLAAYNMRSVSFKDVDLEQRRETYPLDALRQLVRNAFMHRTYECSHAPVRIYWFDDRIEIINPGGPFGSVTAQNFGHPGITDYRNPNLAEAFRALGYVQRFGAGIAIARKALGQRLRFEVGAGTVNAIIRLGST